VGDGVQPERGWQAAAARFTAMLLDGDDVAAKVAVRPHLYESLVRRPVCRGHIGSAQRRVVDKLKFFVRTPAGAVEGRRAGRGRG